MHHPLSLSEKLQRKSYDQVLWLLDDLDSATGKKDRRITEVGQMNIFLVVQGDDGSVNLVTPRLDGTILPGVTRSSVLTLAQSHSPETPLHPSLPASITKINTTEKTLYMTEVVQLLKKGKVLEMFGTATGAVITPVGRLHYDGVDYHIPDYPDGLGPIGRALFETLSDIQEGRRAWDDWSVLCED